VSQAHVSEVIAALLYTLLHGQLSLPVVVALVGLVCSLWVSDLPLEATPWQVETLTN